jgi:hypothetical protein
MNRWLPLTLLWCGCITHRGSIGVPLPSDQLEVALSFHSGKADLLFMVDNSFSMDAMQSELRARFPELLHSLAPLDGTVPIDLHIGVVTSDYGAGDQANGNCEASPGGQAGLLQALGRAADPGCQPPVGARFLTYAVDAQGNVTTNAQTFTCMAAVGSAGCGFEHQLESVYAALHGDAVTSGFLRDDAALTVVFLTNEDDGSAPPTSKIYENDSRYGAFDTFRQTQFGVECGTPPMELPLGIPGAQKTCVPTGALGEYDVERYIDFFTKPRSEGGLKLNPLDVALVSVAPPTHPFTTLLVDNTTGVGKPPEVAYVPCSEIGNNCVERVQHSCQNQAQPAFFGDPAIRLSAVVESAVLNQEISICGDDLAQPPSYSAAMGQIGLLMRRQLTDGCLFRAPVMNDYGPMCNVSLVGKSGESTVPACSSGKMPCWQLLEDVSCPAVVDPISETQRSFRMQVQGLGPGAAVHADCKLYGASSSPVSTRPARLTCTKMR